MMSTSHHTEKTSTLGIAALSVKGKAAELLEKCHPTEHSVLVDMLTAGAIHQAASSHLREHLKRDACN